jgi:hypothetical protein
MTHKRLISWFLLFLLITSLSGCVYLRLLEIKRQLADFERHFSLEYRDALVVVSREPVLLKEDILYLARNRPSRAEEGPRHSMWQYYFVKQYPPRQEEEGGGFDVPVRLFFDKDKLYMGALPARYFKLMPRAFIIEALSAIGRAQVNPITRYAEGRFTMKIKKWGDPLPRRQDFLKLMGRPYSIDNTDEDTTLSFLYSLQRGGPDPSPPSAAWARLTFSRGAEELSKIEAKFAGMRLVLSLGRSGDHSDLIGNWRLQQAAPAYRGDL